jgi:hypothetical protein
MAEQLLEWFIYVDVPALFILHEGYGWTVVHEAVEESLTLAQRLFRTFSFC